MKSEDALNALAIQCGSTIDACRKLLADEELNDSEMGRRLHRNLEKRLGFLLAVLISSSKTLELDELAIDCYAEDKLKQLKEK